MAEEESLFRSLYNPIDVLLRETLPWTAFSVAVSILVCSFRSPILAWVQDSLPSTSFLSIIGQSLGFLTVQQISTNRGIHIDRLRLLISLQNEILSLVDQLKELSSELKQQIGDTLKASISVLFLDEKNKPLPSLAENRYTERMIEPHVQSLKGLARKDTTEKETKALLEAMAMRLREVDVSLRSLANTQMTRLTTYYQTLLLGFYFTGMIVIDMSRNEWNAIWTSVLFTASFTGLVGLTRAQAKRSPEILTLAKETERLINAHLGSTFYIRSNALFLSL